jgi:hypothetical protein
VGNGFVPEEPESIMIGEAALLAVEVPVPDGVRLRRVTSESDVRALSAMQEEVFGGDFAEEMAETLLRRLGLRDGMELWVAGADGEIVGSGRLEPESGVAQRNLNGAAAESTVRSPQRAHDQRSRWGRRCSTATRPKTPVRSSNEQDS